MNHPDKGGLNGASSEFFIVTKSLLAAASLMDGTYAPFGYIVDGFDVAEEIKPGDIISTATVDDWGMQNLVQGKSPTFESFSLKEELESLFD